MATPIPANRAAFTLGEIAEATGGTLRGDPAARAEGVCTDTRGDLGGQLFVALRGERFDAHAFVAAALDGGAAGALVSDVAALPEGASAVIVPDTLVALGEVARAHRRRWGGQVVAIAGSAGKTTTRSCVAAALEVVFPGAVHASSGNLNNRVGVPMVLFGLEDSHRVAVVEVGTNVRGEVASIARIVEPDVGVLTLIDVEHAEGIGTIDDIAAEEGDLLASVRPDGVALGNADDGRVARQLERAGSPRRLTYGTAPEADYRIVERAPAGLTGARLVVERPGAAGRDRAVLDCPLVGLPGALATVAGLAVADAVAGAPVDPALLSDAMGRAGVGESGRLRPVELADGTVVVDDTYNANPASVLAAVAASAEIARARGARLVSVLGEMRELGAESERHHREVGRAVAGMGVASLVAIGGDARAFAEEARSAGVEAVFVETSEAAAPMVRARLRPGDVVLVKASRGVRAERVVEALTVQQEQAS
jgi:UDP-N-acetylmuramoyl-tripeptide--D-alanyl-D-alanine ligase